MFDHLRLGGALRVLSRLQCLKAIEPVGAEQFEQFVARGAEMAKRLQFLKRRAIGILDPMCHVDRMLGDGRVAAIDHHSHGARVVAVLRIANQVEKRGDSLGMTDADHLAALLGYGCDYPFVPAELVRLLRKR